MELKSVILSSLTIVAVLQPVLLAWVTFLGKFISGKTQLAASFVSGLVLGGGAWIATQGQPADFASWFALGIAAILPGLVASGVYETGAEITKKYSG